MNLSTVLAFVKRHKWQVFLTLAGFIVAILMLTIGFFRTLLLLVLTAPCFIYGFLVDKFGFAGANKTVADFFRRKK